MSNLTPEQQQLLNALQNLGYEQEQAAKVAASLADELESQGVSWMDIVGYVGLGALALLSLVP